jgi:phosphatidylserine decarboxylase
MMSLDDDIAAWAATVRLPDAEAAAIFQRIVGTPVTALQVAPSLDPSWWRHFTADFTARMVASTRPVRQAA